MQPESGIRVDITEPANELMIATNESIVHGTSAVTNLEEFELASGQKSPVYASDNFEDYDSYESDILYSEDELGWHFRGKQNLRMATAKSGSVAVAQAQTSDKTRKLQSKALNKQGETKKETDKKR